MIVSELDLNLFIKNFLFLFHQLSDYNYFYLFLLLPSLGAKFRSCKLGFIYNNEMDDFSAPGMPNEFGLPPSPVNFIKPKKRPLSSGVPVIILDENNEIRMVAGGSGGSIITTAVAEVSQRKVLMQINPNLYGLF